MAVRDFCAGGFRVFEGGVQYTGGVSALPGAESVRVRCRDASNLKDGFDRVERDLADAGRPTTAFCACELRSPAPFSESGFRSFNEIYVSALKRLGLVTASANPVARTNVCPAIMPPAEVGFHAFCYTRPASPSAASFVISGSGEVPEGQANYRDHIIRFGDTSPDGPAEKARYVIQAMEQLLSGLGVAWNATTASQVYTVHDIHPFVGNELVARGAAPFGVTWHFANPPVEGLEYEMDCRGVSVELTL